MGSIIMIRSLRHIRAFSTSKAVCYETIKVERDEKLGLIKLNRPKRYNAVNGKMYFEIIEGLKELQSDDTVSIAAIIGEGKFYSSGNDLSAFGEGMASGKSPDELSLEAHDMMVAFVDAFIDFDKPLAALVNGPALGIAVTTLGLCDFVLANETAWFQTPFTKLGQTAEGCSSYTFPKIMGPSAASEFLMFNKKFSAEEACKVNLVGQVYSEEDFHREAMAKVKSMSELPPQSLQLSKQLIRNADVVAQLKATNRAEGKMLIERWKSEECANAIIDFMTRKQS